MRAVCFVYCICGKHFEVLGLVLSHSPVVFTREPPNPIQPKEPTNTNLTLSSAQMDNINIPSL